MRLERYIVGHAGMMFWIIEITAHFRPPKSALHRAARITFVTHKKTFLFLFRHETTAWSTPRYVKPPIIKKKKDLYFLIWGAVKFKVKKTARRYAAGVARRDVFALAHPHRPAWSFLAV